MDASASTLAPEIGGVKLGCASNPMRVLNRLLARNPMRVLIRLTAPIFRQHAVFWFDATGPCLWLIAKEYFVRERGSQR